MIAKDLVISYNALGRGGHFEEKVREGYAFI